MLKTTAVNTAPNRLQVHPIATDATLFHTCNFMWCCDSRILPAPCICVWRNDLRLLSARCLSNEWGCSFSVVDDIKGGEPYDTVEYSRAFFSLFEGAIYLHQVRNDADVVTCIIYVIRNDVTAFFVSVPDKQRGIPPYLEKSARASSSPSFLFRPLRNPLEPDVHSKGLKFHAMLRVPRSKTRQPKASWSCSANPRSGGHYLWSALRPTISTVRPGSSVNIAPL